MSKPPYRHLLSRTVVARLSAIGLGLYASIGLAAPLNISDNALEVAIGVEPNIMLLADDSGSMDAGTMTSETFGIANLQYNRYNYVHPDPGARNGAPARNKFSSYYSPSVVPTEKYMAAQGLAAPQGGVWRYRHSGYNKIYYNPNITYAPWSGVNVHDVPYTNANPTYALYDPYKPRNRGLNLTAITPFLTNCGLPACFAIHALRHRFVVTNFYPAMYYTWSDTNTITPSNAGNGIIDADDDHTLVEIRSTTATYTGHLVYDENTGIGRSDCTDNGDNTATCSYAEEIQNFANWFSYYRKRNLTTKAAFSAAIAPAKNARIGYAAINNFYPYRGTANNLRVTSMNISPNSGNKKTLLKRLFSTRPSGGTPLRRALRQTGQYFECRAHDIFAAPSNSSPGSPTCAMEAAPAGQCQQNYAILMTDGQWNGPHPFVGNTDNDGGDFAGGAFEDGYSDTLADVAMKYYQRDLHSTLADAVPTTTRDITRYLGTSTPFETMHQHMKTYGVSFGINGQLNADPPNASDPFNWPRPIASTIATVDDLRHAAYNGRGLFLNATNPSQLVNAMQDIFNDIASATGTATAVAFNTQEIESGTLVFRASFNTKTNEGDLVAQQLNTDGTIDPTIIWSAANQLDAKVSSSSDTRTIITYKNNGDSTSTGIPFQWAALNTTQQGLLDNPQPTGVSSSTNTFGDERLEYLRGRDQDEGSSYSAGEFRERAEVAGKLGDIVHSTPVFVGKPQFLNRTGGAYPTATPYSSFATTQENRTKMTYVGANDGLLHAFDTSNGSELFAYVPNILMKDMPDLTDPDYTHRYYVDLSPAINDVYVSPTRGTNAGALSWNTVLVGGLNAGGKGYYALNVTNPSDLDTEGEAKNNVMWEFSEADDGGVGSSDLGFSFSQPIITMSNADDGSGNKVWVAIFGNGYNSTSTDGESALYVLRIDGGMDGVWTANSDFYKISTGYGKAESSEATPHPNGIGGVRAVDINNDGTVDYVYAGDLQGNLYRFDLTSDTPGNWVTNTPEILFTARYKANDGFTRDIVQPFTTRPMVVEHPDNPGEFIVIATTGSWMTTEDATSTDIQSIYGIWDDMSGSPEVTMTSTTNQLVEQVFSNYISPEHGFTVRTLTDNPVNWKNTGATSSKVKGWYVDLDVTAAGGSGVEFPGERAVRNLQLRGGILFVNTVIPKDTAACSVGVGGYELGFNPITGGANQNTVFDLDGNNKFTDADNVGDGAGTSNIVTGIRFDGGTPSDAAFIGSRRMTQVGDNIRSFSTNTGASSNTGRTSWREITP
ncbi:MAG: hypothetical protein GXP17_05680 [Gammaproteobacteria bacterium]|nr:hypothetical protein [Gammaproteobacteria bacterium]